MVGRHGPTEQDENQVVAYASTESYDMNDMTLASNERYLAKIWRVCVAWGVISITALLTLLLHFSPHHSNH
jgi:hypothetical protein